MYQRLLPLVIIAILAGCSPSANYAVSPLLPYTTYRYHVYLPLAGVYSPATPTPIPTATPKPCYRTPQAAEFARILTADARQQRTVMRCNPALAQAAQVRAESLAKLDYFAHCDPSGICANAVAIASGCRLPLHYPPNKNSIESLMAGTSSAKVAFDALARSPSHAKHLFGETDFFRLQQDVGIAYFKRTGSPYTYYWVIMVGTCGVNSG